MAIIERINISGNVYNIASTAYSVSNNATATEPNKVANIDGFSLIAGVTVRIKFTNGNTADSPTLTITGGDTLANNPIPISGISTWPAGAILSLTYDGTSWVKDQDEIIANNVTGYGTSGSLVQFNGTNTITNGPAFGTDTTKFLNNKGEWAEPAYIPDTHYTANLIIGASAAAKANAVGADNSIFLNLVENNEVRNSHNIVGAGSVTVASDTSGKITITGNKAGTVTSITPGNGLINGTSGTSQAAITTSGTISIATGGVTNDMLANDWIKIGNTTKHLGETFSLADLGIAAAMNFKGTTTTNLTDGDGTSPISIGGSDYTPVNGDVVLNGGKEFVWTGTAWEELGDESSWALSNDVIHVSGAKGDIIYWLNTNSPTHLTAGTDGQVLKLANGVPTWATDNDTKVTQAYSTSTNNFPLLFSNTPGITSTSSRDATTALVNNSIYVQPSTGTLYATKFVGDGSGLTNVVASSIDWSDVNNKAFANLYVNATAAGAANDTAATDNNTTYIHLYDHNTKQSTIQLVGAGGTTVSSAENSKVITITSEQYGSTNALTSLKVKYNNGTAQDSSVSSEAATPTALGTVTDAVLYIKSMYYGTTSVNTSNNANS